MEDTVIEDIIMEETRTLWDPRRVFRQPEHDSRCIGQMNDVVHSRNPISCQSMQETTKTMVDLAQMPPQSPDMQSHVLRLASLHLCHQWHRRQSHEIVHQ
jgi:hypothetical protein